jgi:hypothetical protein
MARLSKEWHGFVKEKGVVPRNSGAGNRGTLVGECHSVPDEAC